MSSKLLASFVKEFYPEGAVSVRFEVHSEYNDEGYDNDIRYIAVLDAEGNEIAPLPGKSREARQRMTMFPLPFNQYTTDDYLSDYEINLKEV